MSTDKVSTPRRASSPHIYSLHFTLPLSNPDFCYQLSSPWHRPLDASTATRGHLPAPAAPNPSNAANTSIDISAPTRWRSRLSAASVARHIVAGQFSPPSPFPFPTPLDRSYLLCNTDNKTRKILTRSETSSRATKRLYMALIDSPAPPPPQALQPLPLPPPPPPPHQLRHLLEQVTITPFWRPSRPSTAPTLSVRCLCRAHLHTLMLTLMLPLLLPPLLLHSRKPTR